MSDVFLKAIKTALRKFKIGDPVVETDDLSPHTPDDLKKRGFIGSKEPIAPKSFPRPKGDEA